MDMKEIEDEESEDQEEDMENVSYEDDPEDALLKCLLKLLKELRCDSEEL